MPAGVVLSHGGGGSDLVRNLAALTHGDKDAQDAAAFVAAAAGGALSGELLDDAVNRASDSSSDGGGIAMALDEAQVAANKKPADISLLQEIAPSASALSAARGGIYTALSYPHPGQVTDAFEMARNAPHPTSVAAVAGGLLGALHGVHALPVQLISKLELAWVMDTLARDLTTQLLERPSGTQDTAASDPSWWSRYPGW